MSLRLKMDWDLRGYADARDRSYLKRAPGPEMPEVPDADLPDPWAHYLAGFRGGVRDVAREVIEAARECSVAQG